MFEIMPLVQSMALESFFLGVAVIYTRLLVLRSHLSVVGTICEQFDLQSSILDPLFFRHVKQCNLRPLISSQYAVLT